MGEQHGDVFGEEQPFITRLTLVPLKPAEQLDVGRRRSELEREAHRYVRVIYTLRQRIKHREKQILVGKHHSHLGRIEVLFRNQRPQKADFLSGDFSLQSV